MEQGQEAIRRADWLLSCVFVLAMLSWFHESCEPDRNSLPFAAYFRLLQAPRFLLVMLLDFEVQRCTRCCAATNRALEPGDECFSVLEIDGAAVIRRDYCSEA